MRSDATSLHYSDPTFFALQWLKELVALQESSRATFHRLPDSLISSLKGTMSTQPAETGAKRSTPAGLAWFLNLGFLGMGDAIIISKVIAFGWMLYIIVGATLTATHITAEVPLNWLLSFYFTIYSILGLLWHIREAHLGRLRTRAATDIEEGLLSNPQTTDTSEPKEASNKPSAAPVETETPSSSSAGSCCTLGWWLLNLGFLGFANTDWAGKLFCWLSALYTVLGTLIACRCTHFTWGLPPACSAGYQLSGLYFALYGTMLFLSTSRQLQLQRLCAAEGRVALSNAQMASTGASTSNASGYSTLGWILNLGMFGFEGATALSKVYYWIQIMVLISFVALCVVFRHLPGAQWMWTYFAASGALTGLTVIHVEMKLLRSNGHSVY